MCYNYQQDNGQTAFIGKLAFTRPKASWEVVPLNRTREQKSIWDGPAWKATGHALRPAHEWPVPLSYHRPACRRVRELGPQAIALSSVRRPWVLSRSGQFCTIFLNFTHYGSKFSGCFYPFTSTYNPYERWTVSWTIGPHVFEKFGRQTHRQMQQLYIYTVGHKKHTKMCFAITFVKLDGFWTNLADCFLNKLFIKQCKQMSHEPSTSFVLSTETWKSLIQL